jgi:hypothetical protein
MCFAVTINFLNRVLGDVFKILFETQIQCKDKVDQIKLRTMIKDEEWIKRYFEDVP